MPSTHWWGRRNDDGRDHDRPDDEDGDRVREAVEGTLEDGPKTPDLGGSATTDEVTAAIVDRL